MEAILILLILAGIGGNILCIFRMVIAFVENRSTTGFVYLACLFVGLGAIMGYINLKD